MKGHIPLVIVAPARVIHPSQAVDCSYFERNANTNEYIRDMLPGEAPEPMPPGTRVVVKRAGVQRLRAFVPASSEVN